MPIRRTSGGLSTGGNLFDRPGFFDYSEINRLTVESTLLLKGVTETYGITITHATQTGDYNLQIPVLLANEELVTTSSGGRYNNRSKFYNINS